MFHRNNTKKYRTTSSTRSGIKTVIILEYASAGLSVILAGWFAPAGPSNNGVLLFDAFELLRSSLENSRDYKTNARLLYQSFIIVV
jgi:hypothetical protein